jgi:hypothetical protein
LGRTPRLSDEQPSEVETVLLAGIKNPTAARPCSCSSPAGCGHGTVHTDDWPAAAACGPRRRPPDVVTVRHRVDR